MMNNNLQVFNNEQFGQVRVVMIENENWLVGKDVAEALGYKNISDALKQHVDEEDKKKIVYSDYPQFGNKGAILINESGFYSLVMGSKLPNAKAFKRWVTSEVLPQIRQTGGYIPVNQEDDEASIMARALMIAQNTLNKKDELLKAQEKQINILEQDLSDKNKFIKQLSASENSLLVREVAKVASKANIIIGERKLWAKLREWGLIFLNSTEPKQSGIDRGLFEVCEGTRECNGRVFTYRTTRITGKGQAYIIKRLIKEKENEQ